MGIILLGDVKLHDNNWYLIFQLLDLPSEWLNGIIVADKFGC